MTTTFHRRSFKGALMMKFFALAILASLFVIGCSDDEPTTPPDNQTSIRLLNTVYDDTLGLDLYVAGKKVASRVKSGKSSGYVLAGTSGDSVKVGVHYADSSKARIESLQRMYTGGNFSVYAFPPARTFSVSFGDDVRATQPGKSRIKMVNGCPDGGALSVAITDELNPLLGPEPYTELTGYSDINPGKYTFSVWKNASPTNELFAFDSVSIEPDNAYTLVLTGTISDADGWGFIARLYNDNGDGSTYRDLSVAPDRGKILVVHAVPGAPPASVNLDGSATPTINNLAFPLQTPYIDLAAGPHTATVTVGGTPVISNAPFSIVKRGRTTMFLSGSIVPANLAPLELVDLKKPLSTSEASIRVVNLSPDAPNLDGYIVTATGEEKIVECQDLSFRETSYSNTFKGAFFSRFPTTYNMVFKKAGTTEVVVASTPVTVQAGKIVTIWIGGLAASAKLYTVTHN
ncbi:MAG: DUF4397 domain-containing protein [Ignavibacteria bacterium]|nr:DUF4397 domain-containing protein [Ignavibacteria bacterium]MBK7413183.1 DUF4397 domain-containing protein [Ignavibacteria bacterium]MBK9181702.1 DUF4397 domain-containing protein [Ignavibacteria bacterium]MBP6509075.1 DUF4397 domain-containing protein [Candidatus Kapabacteria bacterium]MBP7092904.1 DUF4397 domain-containing protein [Candidatus Kapabacteria bacterium]